MRENSSAFFLRRLHDDDGLTNHNKKEEGRLDMQAADSWQLSPLNEQLVTNGQKNQKQCECEETTVVGMLLLCPACPHSPLPKHCLSTTCLSLPAAFQQLCPFLLIFPSSLLSSLLPSFLPTFLPFPHSNSHSLTLNLPTLSLRRRQIDWSFTSAGGYPDAVSMATGAAVIAVCNRTL